MVAMFLMEAGIGPERELYDRSLWSERGGRVRRYIQLFKKQVRDLRNSACELIVVGVPGNKTG